MPVEVRDLGFEAIKAQFGSSLSGDVGSVRFGSVGDAASAEHVRNDGRGSGLTVATVLSFHEFGAGVPERSVVRAWADENHAALGDAFQTGVLEQLSGFGSPQATLSRIGKIAAEGMARHLRASIPPPLAESTLANPDRNPNGIPLLDTGQILGSLDFEVDA